MLAWSQDRLATEAKVAKATIANFEIEKRVPMDRTLRDIRETFEGAGIVFFGEGDAPLGGPGLRLRNKADQQGAQFVKAV